MSSLNELWRTEEYHVAKSRGQLGDQGQVVIGNAGLAAKYNPIPSIMEKMLDKPCRENVMLAKFTLITHFVKQRLFTERDATDVADDVITWFLDPHCHACHGTGLKNKEQETCPVCLGIKKYPSWDLGKKGCHEVEGLFMWREVQLRKRNRA